MGSIGILCSKYIYIYMFSLYLSSSWLPQPTSQTDWPDSLPPKLTKQDMETIERQFQKNYAGGVVGPGCKLRSFSSTLVVCLPEGHQYNQQTFSPKLILLRLQDFSISSFHPVAHLHAEDNLRLSRVGRACLISFHVDLLAASILFMEKNSSFLGIRSGEPAIRLSSSKPALHRTSFSLPMPHPHHDSGKFQHTNVVTWRLPRCEVVVSPLYCKDWRGPKSMTMKWNIL